MASTKYYISVGVLLLTILVGSYVMITLDNNLRIKVEPTMTTFQSYIDGSWQTAGIEKNALFNGTRGVIRNASVYNITYEIEKSTNFTTIKRVSTYKNPNTPKITDVYTFNGNTKDVELFPISHKVIIENASGLIYQYQVTKLEYKGVTQKDVTSPQSFGKNMKVEWEPGYYYSQIFKYAGVDEGKLTVKYRVKTDYEEYDVRLYDPVLENKTVINTEYIAGNVTYDQFVISSTGIVYVNASVGYLNITANNITILGRMYADGIGYAGGGTFNFCDCAGGEGTGGTGSGPGGAAGGGGARCSYCGGCASASGGGGATSSYMGTNNFTMIFGSGGGGGGSGRASYCSCSCDYINSAGGGAGGGWIAMSATDLIMSGNISIKGANGANGPQNTYYYKSGGGGGGSGGQLYLKGTNINIANGRVDVSGGAGGGGTSSGAEGQGGRVKVQYGLVYTTTGSVFTLGTSGASYVELTGLNITQNSPANLSYTNQSNVSFNCTYGSNSDPYYNVALNLYNSSGTIFKQIFNNTAALTNKTNFVFNWSNISFYQNESGVLNWSCSGYAKAYDLENITYSSLDITTAGSDISSLSYYNSTHALSVVYTAGGTVINAALIKLSDGTNKTLFTIPIAYSAWDATYNGSHIYILGQDTSPTYNTTVYIYTTAGVNIANKTLSNRESGVYYPWNLKYRSDSQLFTAIYNDIIKVADVYYSNFTYKETINLIDLSTAGCGGYSVYLADNLNDYYFSCGDYTFGVVDNFYIRKYNLSTGLSIANYTYDMSNTGLNQTDSVSSIIIGNIYYTVGNLLNGSEVMSKFNMYSFNYSEDMEKGVELSQRTLYLDNYNLTASYSTTNLVNGTYTNVNNQTFLVDISGVPSYNNTYILKNSTGTYLTNLTTTNIFSYTSLPDEYYNLTNNITSCPLCSYTASARTYSSILSTLFNIDTVMPIVNWTSDTTSLNRTANFSIQNWIFGNTFINELNLANVTFRVRNSTGYVNVTTYTY